MRVVKYLAIGLCLLFCIPYSFASFDSINPNNIKLYNNFYNKISNGKTNNKKIEFLSLFKESLESLYDAGKINESNQKNISDIQKLNNEKLFNLKFEEEESKNKIFLNKINALSYYDIFSYNNGKLFLKNGTWYFYDYKKSFRFESANYINDFNLENNGLHKKNILVYKNDDNIEFVKNYQIKKIIPNDLIYGFPNKYELLIYLRNNISQIGYIDDDKIIKEIEEKSLEITKGIYNNNTKIKIIYEYIINKLDYDIKAPKDDYRIYSGIEAFKRSLAVCEGYVELLNMMLGFNNISSIILFGDVINIEDFGRIQHAWIKINNYYYDITFDDPLGQTGKVDTNKYLFFRLPKELMYSDRYDYGSTPEYLKNLSLEERNKIVTNNLISYYKKHKDNNYNILKEFKFRDKYDIPLEGQISLVMLEKIMDNYSLKGNELSNGKDKRILDSFKYSKLENNNIEDYLSNIDYNIEDYIFIEWLQEDGNTIFVGVNKDSIKYID